MADKKHHKSTTFNIYLIIAEIFAFIVLIFAALICTGIISVKHFWVSIDWKWDFWTCAEAIGTVGATIVALFGLNFKEIREKRWSVAKMVSSWISENIKPNMDGTTYVRIATIHVSNESNEPVYDVMVNTTLDSGKHWLGPLSAPNQIPVLPAHRELQFDITIPMLGYWHMNTPQITCTFVDPNGRIWERDIDGILTDCSKKKSRWIAQQDDESYMEEKNFTPFNPLAVCIKFLSELNKNPQGEIIKSLISSQTDAWENIDWNKLKDKYGKYVPTSCVRFPAPQVAIISLIADESLQGKKVEGRGVKIDVPAVITLIFSQKQGWKIFAIGNQVLPEEISFPEGALIQGLNQTASS